VQRFTLFESGFKNIGNMPFRNHERVKRSYGEFVSNCKGKVILTDKAERVSDTKRTGVVQHGGHNPFSLTKNQQQRRFEG